MAGGVGGVDFRLEIDKPLGWTSFDVVKRVRGILTRRYGVKRFKVGHAGTLEKRGEMGAGSECESDVAGQRSYIGAF